ncbi:MAG TPA: hypothetical protein VF447_08570, partial [Terriglobales bacterium]
MSALLCGVDCIPFFRVASGLDPDSNLRTSSETTDECASFKASVPNIRHQLLDFLLQIGGGR